MKVPDRKDFPRMIVWSFKNEKDKRSRIVLAVNKNGSCKAVEERYEEEFLAGRAFSIIDWIYCEPIVLLEEEINECT